MLPFQCSYVKAIRPRLGSYLSLLGFPSAICFPKTQKRAPTMERPHLLFYPATILSDKAYPCFSNTAKLAGGSVICTAFPFLASTAEQ